MGRFDPIYDLLFPTPATCPLCGSVLRHTPNSALFPARLCGRCQAGILEHTSGFCRVCGRVGEGGLCKDCARTPHQFLEARAFGRYEGTLEQAIKGLKYQGDRRLIPILGEWVMEAYLRHFGHARDHLIVPIPMHAKKQLRRGFNQAEVIAFYVVKRLRLPSANVLLKVSPSDSQTTHSRQERIQSLRGAFVLNDSQTLTYNRFADQLLTRYHELMVSAETQSARKQQIHQSLAERALQRRDRERRGVAWISRFLPITARKGAVKTVQELVHGQSILLIDDVLTTGGTADACAEVLYHAGAVSVNVLTVAR